MEAMGGVGHCQPHCTLSSGEILWFDDPGQNTTLWVAGELAFLCEISLNLQVMGFY